MWSLVAVAVLAAFILWVLFAEKTYRPGPRNNPGLIRGLALYFWAGCAFFLMLNRINVLLHHLSDANRQEDYETYRYLTKLGALCCYGLVLLVSCSR